MTCIMAAAILLLNAELGRLEPVQTRCGCAASNSLVESFYNIIESSIHYQIQE